MIFPGDKLVGAIALGDVAVGVVHLGDKLIWMPITLSPMGVGFAPSEDGAVRDVVSDQYASAQARSTPRYGTDVNGNSVLFQPGTHVISGGRIGAVNELKAPSNFDDETAWRASQPATTVLTRQGREVIVQTGAQYGGVQTNNPLSRTFVAGVPFSLSSEVKLLSGDPELVLSVTGLGVVCRVTFTATGEWQRFGGVFPPGHTTNTAQPGTFGVQTIKTSNFPTFAVRRPQAEYDTEEVHEFAGGNGEFEFAVCAGESSSEINPTTKVVSVTQTSEYPDPPWYEHAPAAENHCLSSNNLADGAFWTPTNITPAFTQVGLTGEANTATLLTATADNATIARAAAAAIGSDHAAVYYIKRESGSGTIEISNNNLANFLDITAQVDASPGKFAKIAFRRDPSTATPRPGLRIGTSGDQFIVGNVELYAATEPQNARDFPPIFTAGASVAHGASDCTLPVSILNAASGAIYAEVYIGGDGAIIDAFMSQVSGSLILSDGTNQQDLVMGTNAWHRVGAAWDSNDSLMCLFLNGVPYGDGEFDGNLLQGLLTLFSGASVAGRLRNMKTYEITGV